MTLCVLSVLGISFLVPLLYRILRNKTAFALALLPLAVFTWFLLQYLNGAATTPQHESWVWNEHLNLNLAFHLDALSLIFALLISGIGTLIYIYAGYYMKNARHYGRFFLVLNLFMGAMLGLVLADNWLTMIVFWEMTSITSFLLIGYNSQSETARSAAWQSLLVTASGGLALLAGLVLMSQVTGEYNISALQNFGETITNHSLYLPILLCVCLGAFTKSAQVPFHFWLPNAMSAPTPVSAYLHSATMVTAGVYFLARFAPVLGDALAWNVILCATGGATALTGALMAFRSENLKRLLAYSTISALGLMVLALGIGTKAAILAGVTYLVAHALYKSTLFMLAGIIDKSTGTKIIGELPAGLYRKMPVAFALIVLAGLSLAGVAPLLGFVSKELLLEMVLHAPFYSNLLTGIVVVVGILFTALLLILAHRSFFRKTRRDPTNSIRPIPALFYLPPAVAAIAGLFLGIFPESLDVLTSRTTLAIAGEAPNSKLALWHGFNKVFILSLVSVIAGVGLYYWKGRTFFSVPSGVLNKWTPSAIYDGMMDGLLKWAVVHNKNIQTGHLRSYAMYTLLVIVSLTGATFFYKSGVVLNTEEIELYVFEVVLGVIVALGLGFILISRSKIAMLLALSVVGIAISIIFLVTGAYDLAIAFFLIDTLTITIFVLILHKLPKKMVAKNLFAKYRDALIAVGTGLVFTFILWAITAQPLQSQLKEFYAENSHTEAHGRNMVNVILVDFRVLDTFGESIVVAIAALGVFALVNYSKKNEVL